MKRPSDEEVTAALREEFPWLAFLSKRDVAAFMEEYLQGDVRPGVLGQLREGEIVTQAWRSSADLAGDTELRERLDRRLREKPIVAADPRTIPKGHPLMWSDQDTQFFCSLHLFAGVGLTALAFWLFGWPMVFGELIGAFGITSYHWRKARKAQNDNASALHHSS